MGRNQIRFVLGISVLVVIVVLGYLGARLRQDAETRQLLDEIAGPDGAVTQRMSEFRRIKMKGGKKVWEIAARQARYLTDSNTVVIDSPEISLYFQDGETVELHCREGTIHLHEETQDLVRIDLNGDLRMQVGDVSFTTNRAVYDHHDNTIVSDGTLNVVGEGFTAAGRGYSVAVDTKRLVLDADVRTTVTRKVG